MGQAELIETETGLVPRGAGWFILNAGEASWEAMKDGGIWVGFEPTDGPPNAIGVGLHRLGPGEATGFYHHEADQEGFFVLEGECLVVVDGEEHALRQWDYFHCPPDTPHIIVGGDAPATLFMLGGRTPGRRLTHYPVDPVAAGHGASVAQAADGKAAYAGLDRTTTPVRAPFP